jgi:hypothetical protein
LGRKREGNVERLEDEEEEESRGAGCDGGESLVDESIPDTSLEQNCNRVVDFTDNGDNCLRFLEIER